MTNRQKLKKRIVLTKNLIKYIKEDFGAEMCEEFEPQCPNCIAQILLGYLRDYLDLCEYSKEND